MTPTGAAARRQLGGEDRAALIEGMTKPDAVTTVWIYGLCSNEPHAPSYNPSLCRQKVGALLMV